MISCFLDFTMAELLSVSLLKKAGGWVLFPGDLEPILQSRRPSETGAGCGTHIFLSTEPQPGNGTAPRTRPYAIPGPGIPGLHH